MSSIKLGLNFSRIVHQINCSATFISTKEVKVIIPGGFPYEAFNPRACITPWSLIKMVESARGASFSSNFLEVSKLYNNYFIFIVSTSTKVSPELYNLSSIKGPLVQNVALDYVGNTSFRLKTVMHIEGCKEPVCENFTQSVLVDIQTRKPSPPPDWWFQKFSLGDNNGEPLKLDRLIPPSDVQVHENYLEVPASDVDSYQHVNWSSYIKYFYESYIQSELKKASFKDSSQLFRNLRNFSVSYIQEANIGDKLKIRFWESKNTKELYHFQLLRDEKVVNDCSFELYPLINHQI